jgi:hypothetical protein
VIGQRRQDQHAQAPAANKHTNVAVYL